jgi:DNA helicase-2/ATP-dependent DNA helicase PcrA
MSPHQIASFATFLETHLNDEQRKAVTHEKGSILVVAGAGSGKTRVITARITNLILNHQMPAESIVALTFTNKAALEMRERISHFLGNDRILPFIGTFHSYCVRLLRRNQHMLDNPFFSILDETDQQKLISTILQRNDVQKKITARQVAYYISHIKNHMADPTNPTFDSANNRLMHELYIAYEQEKRTNKSLDFDDLLLETLTLFKKNQNFKEQFQSNIRHILVDEYQDTNVVQHSLLKEMAQISARLAVDSICVVGDEDQSIYSWRGATVTNILNFKHDFPKTSIIKIEQNYRSVQPILDAANHVIQNNYNRNPKTLWSERKGIDRIRTLTCLSEYQEADIIAQLLTLGQQHKQLDTFAVLYRTHAQSRAIEEGLIKHAIPYKIIGGTQFYERKEIRDIIAYLRLIINPFDRASLFRVINTPSRGLGAQFEQQFYTTWHNEPFLTYTDMVNKLITTEAITPTKQKGLKKFLHVLDGINPDSLPSIATQQIINRSEYISYIQEAYDPEDARARIENIQELLDAIKHAESEGTRTITGFIEDVTLMQEKSNNQNAHTPVLLMTLHAAKGLEFDTVILAGLEEGLLPSTRSMNATETLEEERRLFYVGITRAKERLLLTQSKYRYTYGQMVDQCSSRFVGEIPQSLLHQYDCSYWKNPEITNFFSDWLLAKKPQLISQQASHKTKSLTFEKKTILHTPTQSACPSQPSPAGFKINHPVSHAKYGIGIVQNIEERTDTTYVTVKFKTGTKKITSNFLQKI